MNFLVYVLLTAFYVKNGCRLMNSLRMDEWIKLAIFVVNLREFDSFKFVDCDDVDGLSGVREVRAQKIGINA